jgi:hypothetical protein
MPILSATAVPLDRQVKASSSLYDQSGFGVNHPLDRPLAGPPTTRIWDKQGLLRVGLVELRRPRLAGKILAYFQSL